jgi:CelD/BcsL family acetyltransferase involved in cellulose biosynthesis
MSQDLVLESLEDFESIRDEWSSLADGSGNIFATWHWASTWWRHFGREGRLLLTACQDDERRLVGLLPLYLWSTRPVRVARFIGHHAGDQLGPICRARDRARVAAALRQMFARTSLDVLVGEQVAASEQWSDRLGARVLSREASPVLSLAGRTWEEYLAARSRNFREQVRRRERKLVRERELHFRLADNPERLSADLDVLFRLHGERWAGARTNFAEREAFHREFAAQPLKCGWLRLWLAYLDGEPAAAWYGFRLAGIESYYQAGRSSTADRTSIGFVLLAHSIREAFRDGMKEYRFLRGGEGYKFRFADSDAGLETIAVSGGAVGHLAVDGASMLRRVRRFATGATRRSRSQDAIA